ncbi:MAG: ABC transporter substrate-binding protein [Coriobacteriales bacterium]|nr:ABC transporter substrate-binding protein [Coriobacteriales bacterium]
MFNVKKLGAIACAAALALSLGACGGSSSSSSQSSSGSSDSSTTSTTSYTTVEDGKLIGVSDMAYPPLESISDSTNQPEGFEIDMMDAVAQKLGLQMEWLEPTKFDTIIPLIKQGGKADVGVSAFTITDERKDEIDFTDSYLDSNQGLVTKADSANTTEESLNVAGKKIACQSGTTGEAWIEENLPNATVVPLDDAIQAMTGVQTGLYDACVADLPVVSYLCKQSYTDCKVAIQIPTGEQYGIVVSKDNPGLTAAINQALQELKDDGTMDSLEQKWFGTTL